MKKYARLINKFIYVIQIQEAAVVLQIVYLSRKYIWFNQSKIDIQKLLILKNIVFHLEKLY